MKRYQLTAGVIAILTAFAAVAAEQGTPTIAPGVYEGRVVEVGGSRSSEFRIDLTSPRGTITMYKAVRACAVGLPIQVVSDASGVRLESKGEGVPQGCDRVFHDLVITDTGFTGKMTGTSSSFTATASRK